MIASAEIRLVDLRRATVFAEANHERVVQQAAAFEIQNQPGISLVESGQQLIDHAWEVFVVRVPSVPR